MFTKVFFLAILITPFICIRSYAQADSIKTRQDTFGKKNILTYDTATKKHSPKLAALRSAILPGWGQAYNKKYWKIPIVYAALGITGGIFFYNLKTYKLLKQAVILRSDNDPGNDSLVDRQFRTLPTESIRQYRNYYRQNIDYSVLVFVAFWGLNVVDAVVDAHLKSFDVSNDISLRIRPRYDPFANSSGISLVFSFKNKPSKVLTSAP